MAAYSAALLFITLLLILCSFQRAQAADCTSALTGLLGCSTFLTNTSSTPDQKSCCTPLNTVLLTPSSLQCLCAQAASSDSAAYKNALLLPKACNLSITVSEANCTQSSSSSTTSNSTQSSAGFASASSMSSLLALALLWSLVSFFAYNLHLNE